MILKATIGGLILVLIVVLVLTYYNNEEGFISNPTNPAYKMNAKPIEGDIVFCTAFGKNGMDASGTAVVSNAFGYVYTGGKLKSLDQAGVMEKDKAYVNATGVKPSTLYFDDCSMYTIAPLAAQAAQAAKAAQAAQVAQAAQAAQVAQATPTDAYDILSPRSMGKTAESTADMAKMGNKSQLLSDIQNVVRNELATQPQIGQMGQMGQMGHNQDSDSDSDTCGESCDMKEATTASCGSMQNGTARNGTARNGTMQGGTMQDESRYARSERRHRNQPDMSKYIRKDSIPCAGCTLDY
jgi:hypothetical protein